MADRLAGGRLAEILTRYQDAGVSNAAITKLLEDDYGIEVSRETVRRWCHEAATERENGSAGPAPAMNTEEMAAAPQPAP